MAQLAVAHVLSSFGMGGQERVALDLAAGQRSAGCRVLAVSIGVEPGGALAAEFSARGIEARWVPKRPGFDPSLWYRLARLVHDQRIDVVHSHNPQPLIYAIPAARIAGALAVHTKHGNNPDGGRRLLMRRLAASLADAFVAVSPATAEVARARREVSAARLHTIPNGIDLARFHPDEEARAAVRAELGIPADAWVVGTVGRLAAEKNQALLLAAMAPLLGAKGQLILVGDGAEAAALRGQAAQLGGAGRVHFVGARHDVPRLLAALDVFVLSSRTEGLPLVVCEAMATALPVVATAVGGVPDVIDEGLTGHLVPSGNVDALSARLAALALDPARAVELGARGRQVALTRFSSLRMVQGYLALYDALRHRDRTRRSPWRRAA